MRATPRLAFSSSIVPYAAIRWESLGTRVPPTRAVVPSSPVRVYTRVIRTGIPYTPLWESSPCHQSAQDHAIVGGIRLSVLLTVVYLGKIRRGHLLPELLETGCIVALRPCGSQEKL